MAPQHCMALLVVALIGLPYMKHATVHAAGCPAAVVGIYGQQTGNITSPSYPANYDNDLNCRWTINLEDTNKSLTFNLTNLDIETSSGCTKDVLKIYNGYNSSDSWFDLCGSQAFQRLEGKSDFARVEFTTDNSGVGGGFSLDWFAEPARTCPHHQVVIDDQETGSITSTLYPESYYPNQNCLWSIRVSGANKVLSFNLTDTEIEGSGSNCPDSLRIYNGYDSSTVWMNTCGTHTSQVVTGSSDWAIVEFVSDSSANTNKGFRLSWTTETITTTAATTEPVGTANLATMEPILVFVGAAISVFTAIGGLF